MHESTEQAFGTLKVVDKPKFLRYNKNHVKKPSIVGCPNE
jgi:hypothetical protein